MSTRKLLRLDEGLRNTRRSLGDGTLGGRSRIATPYEQRRLRRPTSIVQSSGPLPISSGTPIHITVEAADVEVAAPTAGPVMFDQLVRDAGFPVEVPTDGVTVPVTGSWLWGVSGEWADFDQGGTVELLVDGEVVWPLSAGEGAESTPPVVD